MSSRKLLAMPTQETQTSLDEPILTGEQVAQRLQLNPSTIYELTRRRNKRPLPCLRVGKYLRFYWSDVQKWLKEA